MKRMLNFCVVCLVDLPDDFFETTSEDLARAMEVEKNMKKQHDSENATLRTREQVLTFHLVVRFTPIMIFVVEGARPHS